MTAAPIQIVSGDVLPAYPYLWLWQRDRGEEAGRKERPVCVAIVARDGGGLTHLAILAISGTPPNADQKAIELPALEIRRIGLRAQDRAWIVVSEYNYDCLERSFVLEPPREPLKRLSPGFLKVVAQALRPVMATAAGRVDRV